MNPLLNEQKPQINPQMINTIKSMNKALKFANEPNLALSALCQQNPQLKNVVELCRGRDPKAVFYESCQSLGYDPDEIIKLLM